MRHDKTTEWKSMRKLPSYNCCLRLNSTSVAPIETLAHIRINWRIEIKRSGGRTSCRTFFKYGLPIDQLRPKTVSRTCQRNLRTRQSLHNHIQYRRRLLPIWVHYRKRNRLPCNGVIVHHGMRPRITRRIRQTISKIPRISGPRSCSRRTTSKTDGLPLANGDGPVTCRRQRIDARDRGLGEGG